MKSVKSTARKTKRSKVKKWHEVGEGKAYRWNAHK